MKKKARQKFEGVLLGLAVGDALAAPMEFMTAGEIDRKYGSVREMIGGGKFNLKPGEYTDDTSMMLCITESLVANQGYDPDDIARRFVNWYRSDPKDIGNTTRDALAKIARGTSWKEAGDKDRPTNGSVMRCAPIGLFFANDEQKLIKASVETSAMTHAHTNSVMSCVFVNLMIARLVSGAKLIEALDYARKVTSKMDRVFAESISCPVSDSASGRAVDTIQLASKAVFGAYNWRTYPFERAIKQAISFGGDTDTIASVTGALAGAHWGVSAIPEKWSSKINPYTSSKIKELGGELFELASSH